MAWDVEILQCRLASGPCKALRPSIWGFESKDKGFRHALEGAGRTAQGIDGNYGVDKDLWETTSATSKADKDCL